MGAPRPPHIDLGTGDPAGHRETLRARSRPCNGARQGGDLVRKDGIKACGAAQPVPDGIARRPRLALGRFRTTAAASVSATRFAPGFTDHAGSGAGHWFLVFVLARFKPARKQNLEPRLPSFSRNWDVPDEIKSRVNADHIRPNCSKSTSRDAVACPSGLHWVRLIPLLCAIC